jgi:hypothetical protein
MILEQPYKSKVFNLPLIFSFEYKYSTDLSVIPSIPCRDKSSKLSS